jgi:hypothetical protein
MLKSAVLFLLLATALKLPLLRWLGSITTAFLAVRFSIQLSVFVLHEAS